MPGSKNQTAEIVLPSGNINETVSFFSDELGFQLESIFPADDPIEAVFSGYGLRIRLRKDKSIHPGIITISEKQAENITAPNGTKIQFRDSEESYFLPEGNQSLQVSRLNEAQWKIGRAGMEYRDLIPDRYGGRFIASHIRIAKAGPVPDYVHYHKIRFQIIFCYKGWAKVVYEDQGEPFFFMAGDCILQPPEIRHRVLENSNGFEVVEISSPASHMTCTDPELDLPTGKTNLNRVYNGQNFVHHIAKKAEWHPWRQPGFEVRNFGLSNATNGLANVSVVKSIENFNHAFFTHEGEFHFIFLLNGGLTLDNDQNDTHSLNPGDSITIPTGSSFVIIDCPINSEFLEIHFQNNI
jgi:quercetin dioxygenase-like cupin family protein